MTAGEPDPHELQRFVSAQDAGGTYQQAVAELRRGRKVGHWIWFVFPQIAGLGQSPTAVRYSISSLDEARAYLRHPVLGPRLTECAGIVAQTYDRTAEEIFGSLDAMKLRSSMTLFLRAAPDQPVFGQVLAKYFGGEPDPATDRLLQPRPGTEAPDFRDREDLAGASSPLCPSRTMKTVDATTARVLAMIRLSRNVDLSPRKACQ
jgi:uncharacterized protein (DUF1810 family)